MITRPVTKKQLAAWQALWQQRRASMQPNRISGLQLDAYFREKYRPKPYKNAAFADVVRRNVTEYTGIAVSSEIVTYQLHDALLIGIDLLTGYFHVESENFTAMAAIWDDLFVTRGLSAADLENYVLTAQYILLQEKAAAQE